MTEDAKFYVYASCILLLIGVIGFIANIGNIYLIHLSKTIQCSYGYICVSHSIAEALNSFIACGCPIFITLFDQSLTDSTVTYVIGEAAMGICVLTSHMCLYKALNRFVAITKPFAYRKLFSHESVMCGIIALWTVCVLHSCVGFIDGCYFAFDPEYMYWYFVDTVCGHFLGFYIDLLYSCLIMMIVIALDLTTLILLITFRNRSAHQRQALQSTRCHFLRSILRDDNAPSWNACFLPLAITDIIGALAEFLNDDFCLGAL
uniref:7TM_GPCR_Srx domain-containing protein n=1 Tax=Panagrellus redivivus TaxID=6233 RepID=A0A7E4USW6_PANRE